MCMKKFNCSGENEIVNISVCTLNGYDGAAVFHRAAPKRGPKRFEERKILVPLCPPSRVALRARYGVSCEGSFNAAVCKSAFRSRIQFCQPVRREASSCEQCSRKRKRGAKDANECSKIHFAYKPFQKGSLLKQHNSIQCSIRNSTGWSEVTGTRRIGVRVSLSHA